MGNKTQVLESKRKYIYIELIKYDEIKYKTEVYINKNSYVTGNTIFKNNANTFYIDTMS